MGASGEQLRSDGSRPMLRCRIQSAFNKGLEISIGPNNPMDSIAIKLESPKIKEEVYVAHRL